jgi:hypothetical protein
MHCADGDGQLLYSQDLPLGLSEPAEPPVSSHPITLGTTLI